MAGPRHFPPRLYLRLLALLLCAVPGNPFMAPGLLGRFSRIGLSATHEGGTAATAIPPPPLRLSPILMAPRQEPQQSVEADDAAVEGEQDTEMSDLDLMNCVSTDE